LLTTAPEVDVVGEDSSGEVEFVLVAEPDAMYVGVGSDHTDRKVEAYGVTVSKQMCPKPIGRSFGDSRMYKSIGPARAALARDAQGKAPALPGRRGKRDARAARSARAPRRFGREALAGTAMFCGTLAVQGEIGGGERFEIELHDPLNNRSLRHGYATRSLTIAD